MLTERDPVTCLERVNGFSAIVERVARLVTNKNIIHTNEVTVVVCIEPVYQLCHIGVCDIAKGPSQSMLEKSGAAEGEIEPTVPRFPVERSHVVGVSIELLRNDRRESLEECYLVLNDFELDGSS